MSGKKFNFQPIKLYNMEISRVHSLFFSATFSTKKIIRRIVGELGIDHVEHDITGNIPEGMQQLGANDLLVVGVPVFSGRVPDMAVEGINRIQGNNTPAVIVCVYGNRDYDDALIELRNIVREKGFVPIAAAAVIAQHSIFSQIAENRPDTEDFLQIHEFCRKVKRIIDSLDSLDSTFNLQVRGNEPYRQTKNIPIHPTGNHLCNQCGACVKLCPTHAIPLDSPRKTDKEKCISCGRCIVICPQKARKFRGILFTLAAWKFKKNYSIRKEPAFFLNEIEP